MSVETGLYGDGDGGTGRTGLGGGPANVEVKLYMFNESKASFDEPSSSSEERDC